MDKAPITSTGFATLEAALKHLKTVERPAISEKIGEAADHGDLKENAEYHAAREQQSFAEGRIKELEYKVSNAQVIDITALPHTGRVLFGATVDLINIDDDSTVSYRVVGEDEADVKQNMISVNSPIARALIGKSEGDEIVVKAPGGDKFYEIDTVRHI